MIAEAGFTIPQAVAPGDEVLAIGDIHGEADLLEALLVKAEVLPPMGRRVLVFTGDLIDRGPRGFEALRLAEAAAARIGAAETMALMGNHEQMLRCALAGAPARQRHAYALWIANGGDALLREVLGPDWERSHSPERLRLALGDGFTFVQGMRPYWRSGDLLFVHAGISSTVLLESFLAVPWDVDFRTLHEDEHWAWIRQPFLEAERHGGLFFVHGHTPPDNVTRHGPATVARSRLNLDLGSGRTGMARMARFVGYEVTVYDAG